ncbi:YceD family protein [Luteolibacter algae]|uniref:YceD family protein n=1 Tax=Luteolibacter algae TaxID=454151 RepID=A0ABW5D9N2_9BACT
MNQSLIIDLPSLPEEGKAFSGELDGAIFDLPKGDAQPAGPLEYNLWIQRFGSELLLTGKISAPFTFTCVVTLKNFVQTIELNSATIAVEIENSSQVDVTEALREEVLLEFPTAPRCDEGDNPEPCEIDSRYLAVDKPVENGLSPAPRNEGTDQWSALNDLTGLNDQT